MSKNGFLVTVVIKKIRLCCENNPGALHNMVSNWSGLTGLSLLPLQRPTDESIIMTEPKSSY